MFKEINLNTFTKLHILIDLSYLKGFEGTISEYEKEIGRVKRDTETRDVFGILKEKEIAYPTIKKYSFQLYKLNIKLLCKLIEQQAFVQRINKYLDYVH